LGAYISAGEADLDQMKLVRATHLVVPV